VAVAGGTTAFRDRADAAGRLVAELRGLDLRRPLVLAIPRGGVEIGAVLARELGAELDVVLSRKLRAPGQPELAIGAISEDGAMRVDERVCAFVGADAEYLERERRLQMEEIRRRQELLRAVRPRAAVRGRSVIVTDDGIATGSTMVAALQTVRAQGPAELIVAVPVGPRKQIEELEPMCDRIVCPLRPDIFWAIGQFYERFEQVDDARVVELLREALPAPTAAR
jgi:hypothetical protein